MKRDFSGSFEVIEAHRGYLKNIRTRPWFSEENFPNHIFRLTELVQWFPSKTNLLERLPESVGFWEAKKFQVALKVDPVLLQTEYRFEGVLDGEEIVEEE